MTVTTNTIAELGALIGDPGRANMLIALLDGRALTARELADRAGVTPQTASRHLGKLLEAGLLRMERQGRRHYHRLATPDVARMLEAMHVAAAGSMTASHPARTGTADPHMREARSCYDHLAGRIAVELAATLTAASDEAPFRSPRTAAAGSPPGVSTCRRCVPAVACFAEPASTGASGDRTSRGRSAPRCWTGRSGSAGSADARAPARWRSRPPVSWDFVSASICERPQSRP